MLLEIEGLNTYYGESHALRDFSLTVGEGEIVALLGRNGMGKSTALKSVVGLVRASSGRVLYRGKDLAGAPPYKVARAAANRSATTWTFERIYEHFSFMRERTAQKGRLLSGGEQQMLAIARTLMGNPDLVLVDEPTEGLAPLV